MMFAQKAPRDLKHLLIAVSALLATPLAAEETPRESGPVQLEATYKASLEKGIPVKGSATRSVKQLEDGSWLSEFRVDSFIADITETSRFLWRDGQAYPSTYRYALEGLVIPDRHRAMNFNWADNRVTGNYEDTEIDMELPPQTLDPLNYQLQLRQDLKSGQTEMHYQIVNKNRLDDDTYKVVGEEIIDSQLGTIDTVKVEKVRAPEKKRKTFMWFAPEWDYLLVRLVQIEDDGTRYEIHLENATVAGEAVTPPSTP
ncbi:DUF3108 domain-containing protein [Marinobacter nanhaiticus D15-8W]|uniref:DUF3108 domain-containing protein n=1 Tax=Marinobacter nanhaiticus D15-8W TaxID=626887 RepID=N6VW57_9GAMM|nr:DUF3108 domain-containing protein [Marinobacter nanhaiticus]ENO14460.1 DUF3108 domain-containing protein [Marinobacter nanhaiticus D15-8W]BES71853.1 DUF3108 domain-containing protein [Marinobacter nanhaiticus D15-8W]